MEKKELFVTRSINLNEQNPTWTSDKMLTLGGKKMANEIFSNMALVVRASASDVVALSGPNCYNECNTNQ